MLAAVLAWGLWIFVPVGTGQWQSHQVWSAGHKMGCQTVMWAESAWYRALEVPEARLIRNSEVQVELITGEDETVRVYECRLDPQAQ